jgi:hypothetical protein
MFLSVIIPVLNEVQTISLILFSGTILLALETVGRCLAGTCKTAASRGGSRFDEKMPSHHPLTGERFRAHR